MRRVIPVLVGLVIVAAGIYGLQQFFGGAGSAELSTGSTTGPGTLEDDLGDEHRAEAGAEESSPPPTSGPHEQRNLTKETTVTDAELLHALEIGDVALVYGSPKPPAGLARLRDDATGAFDPELAAAGQTAFLVRRRGVEGIQALAWRHRIEVQDASDPKLREFVDAWLGKGAGA